MRLTAAQRRFLRELARGEHYPRDVLRGSEWQMAERLCHAGLVRYGRAYERKLENYYSITEAGREALAAYKQ